MYIEYAMESRRQMGGIDEVLKHSASISLLVEKRKRYKLFNNVPSIIDYFELILSMRLTSPLLNYLPLLAREKKGEIGGELKAICHSKLLMYVVIFIDIHNTFHFN